MKHSVWKQILALTICALFVLTGCRGGQVPAETDSSEQILAELAAMKQQLESAQTEIQNIKNDAQPQNAQPQNVQPENVQPAPADTTTPEPIEIETEVPVKMVYGVSCTVNGQSSVKLDGNTAVRAVADPIEGMEFDHWSFGETTDYESGPDATFYFSEPTVVRAHYHERRIVRFINCHMNFINGSGKAVGDPLKEFDFEEDYTIPATKQACEGGEVSFFVTADIPKGKEVDYWLINGVEVKPANQVDRFRVREQDHAAVYEVVFKNVPATYYNVTCHSCTFSGGGVNGTSGKVKAGTQITVYGHSSSSACYFVGTPSAAGRGSYGSPMSAYKSEPPAPGHIYWTYYFKYTYTVTSDTEIWFYGIIN